jgi:hypothetical protein
MANGGMKNSPIPKTVQEGKVTPYMNQAHNIKGCGQSYPNGMPGKGPTHVRTQNYHPELIRDHTGARADKGNREAIVAKVSNDCLGSKPSMIGLEGVVNDHQRKQSGTYKVRKASPVNMSGAAGKDLDSKR